MARTKSDSFSRTVKFYDSNFNLVEKPVTGKIYSATSIAEAETLLGGQEAHLDACNTVLRAKQIETAMASVTGGQDEKNILSFVKNFRAMPDYAPMSDADATAAILAKIKSEPFLLAALKAHCAAKQAEGSEE